MARQLLNFLKAKKNRRCWGCECLTLNQWRNWQFCYCVSEVNENDNTPDTPDEPVVPNTYSVFIQSNDTDYGTVDTLTVEDVEEWTSISANDNVLTIGEATITATAEEWYVFSRWAALPYLSDLPATVTDTLGIVAVFEAESDDDNNG